MMIMVSQVHTYVKNSSSYTLQTGTSFVYKLYLNKVKTDSVINWKNGVSYSTLCSLLLCIKFSIKKKWGGASLVAQWLRIPLLMQGTRVWALVQEDPTCRGATKPMCHNYWACALEPMSHNYWAHMPQLLKPMCLEPVLHNTRSHHNEKPMHRNEE